MPAWSIILQQYDKWILKHPQFFHCVGEGLCVCVSGGYTWTEMIIFLRRGALSKSISLSLNRSSFCLLRVTVALVLSLSPSLPSFNLYCWLYFFVSQFLFIFFSFALNSPLFSLPAIAIGESRTIALNHPKN